MRFRSPAVAVCAAALFLLGMSVQAQQTLTVARLIEFVKSSIQQKNSDKDVAKFLSTTKLSERLTPQVVEELQSDGAGPKTIAALVQMVNQTESLKPAPAKIVMTAPAPTGPREPSEAEKKKALDEVTSFSRDYVKSLPDFVCMQVTRRSVDMHYQPGSDGSWSQYDRLVEKLTFFDHKEKYDLMQQNDEAMVGKTWQSVGGSISRGEWATVLAEIFDPATHTEFHWVRWGNLRGNLTHVFQYRVEQKYSHETIAAEKEPTITTGFHGLLYVEQGDNVPLRITVIPDIPADYPLQDVDQLVDYDVQKISEESFLLPLRSKVTMRNGHMGFRNEIEWRQYHKYSAGTTITFDTTDDKPLPDDKTKEQPVTGQPAPKQ
ncbi:MAG TPA: hypothetical protein VHC72_03675 [Bryobacteraceae bacterium]|nr:hypothetical protein [Bryobacteraceae bacterium]